MTGLLASLHEGGLALRDVPMRHRPHLLAAWTLGWVTVRPDGLVQLTVEGVRELEQRTGEPT